MTYIMFDVFVVLTFIYIFACCACYTEDHHARESWLSRKLAYRMSLKCRLKTSSNNILASSVAYIYVSFYTKVEKTNFSNA